jgi:serine/threonine protein kinase
VQAGTYAIVRDGTKGLNDDQVMHAMSVDDSYHVERVLAHGQGGITELVTLDGTGPFVRKRIPAARAHRGVWAALPEIDCARLPHIEATYEMPDEFIVVYDYVPGETLEQLVESRGKLDAAKARHLVGEVCQAVSKLHAHDIVHRDITPSNVVVAADGAHLIDFGIARLGSEDAKGNEDQLGTWGFAAPE